jgi:hypothetical protein
VSRHPVVQELRTAGYESVEQAIWDIATNYTKMNQN